MGLVEYSESEDETPSVKTKRRRVSASEGRQRSEHNNDHDLAPPLPSSFRDLYSSSVRLSNSDDPSLHAGRRRVVPHVAGNWPAHVYLECRSISFIRASLVAITSFFRRRNNLPVFLLLRKYCERRWCHDFH